MSSRASALSKTELFTLVKLLYEEYHRDIAKQIEPEFKKHALQKIISFISEKNSILISDIENCFNCMMFETNYSMSFARFTERFNQIKKDSRTANETKGTPFAELTRDYIERSRSESNRKEVERSLKTKIVSKTALYSPSEIKQLNPNWGKSLNVDLKSKFKSKR